MESPQAESSAKRRRLTHRDMHVAAWTEGSSSEKKKSECEDVEIDRVKIKKEKVAEPIHVVGKDVQWLKAKKEIKDDMEQDMKSSNFDDVDDVPLKEVEVKDEIENDAEDHDKSPRQSEVAVKQEVRRRLTRKVQVSALAETSRSEKKQSECEDVQDDSVRIKKEKVAEPIHVVGKDIQWLKVKKEIKNDMEQDMKSSNFDDVDDVPLKEVEVKDEMETDEEDHDKSPQKPEVAVKQEVRGRLTRKVQVAAWGLKLQAQKRMVVMVRRSRWRQLQSMKLVSQVHLLMQMAIRTDVQTHTSAPSKGKTRTPKSSKALICFTMIEMVGPHGQFAMG